MAACHGSKSHMIWYQEGRTCKGVQLSGQSSEKSIMRGMRYKAELPPQINQPGLMPQHVHAVSCQEGSKAVWLWQICLRVKQQ